MKTVTKTLDDDLVLDVGSTQKLYFEKEGPAKRQVKVDILFKGMSSHQFYSINVKAQGLSANISGNMTEYDESLFYLAQKKTIEIKLPENHVFEFEVQNVNPEKLFLSSQFRLRY